MRNLKTFIEDNNRWIALFGEADMTFPLTQQDVNDLAKTIDAKLSPENLHCDGEISAAQAQAKYRRLMNVASELQAYTQSNNLTMPNMYEVA